ncbi:MAG: DUF1015 family protein, partial [Zetaproteobacteria bacterium]
MEGYTAVPEPPPPPYMAATSPGGMGRYCRFAWSRRAKSCRATATGRAPVFLRVTRRGRTVSASPLGRPFHASDSTATMRPGTSWRMGPATRGDSGTNAFSAQAASPAASKSRPAPRAFPLTRRRRPSRLAQVWQSHDWRVCGVMSTSRGCAIGATSFAFPRAHMAEIIPFRALRYNPRLVPDLERVVAPPYDVISPEAQERYHARHPYNVVRLILGKGEASDTADDNRYTRAAATFVDWRRAGILRRDAVPSMYLYEQEFSLGDGPRLRRRGLLALVRLHEYAERAILPHERTFSRYKDDRLRLMRACPANLEAILGFYPGPNPTVTAILDRHAEADPAVRLLDEDGVGHRLWLLG